jgi:hypothetical protein
MVVTPPLGDHRDPRPGSKEHCVQPHWFVTKPTPQ